MSITGTGVISLIFIIIVLLYFMQDSYSFDKERAERDREIRMSKVNWKEIEDLLKTGRYELTFTPYLGLPLLHLKDETIKEVIK